MQVKSAYTRLLVSDIQTCFLFYKDVMEFEVVVDAQQSGYAEFKVGNMRLSLFRRQEMAEILRTEHKQAEAECQDKVALIFTVNDAEAEYRQLLHKSVEIIAEPMTNSDYKIKTVYLRDPDKNLIGLYQFLD